MHIYDMSGREDFEPLKIFQFAFVSVIQKSNTEQN